MASPKLKLTLLAMVTLAGCSQILGIDDYEIDQSLDAAAGGEGNQGPAGEAGEPTTMGGMPGASGAGGVDPEIIDCDSTECCADAGGTVTMIELLPNGDFETGRTAWGTNSQNMFEVFTKQTAESIPANSGSWFAWIGGSQNDIGVLLSPKFSIPEGTGWLGVEGYRWLAFDSAALMGDYAQVDMYDAAGEFEVAEERFFYWDNAEYDSNDWALFALEVPLGVYTGTEHHIGIVGVTDDMYDVDADDPEDQEASNFFFDDLSFKAFSCRK
jgi:hypothetical protein